MPRKVSNLQKQEILDSFKNGENIKSISKSFNFTVSTITRQLKSILGERKFLEIKDSKNNILDNLNEQSNQNDPNLRPKENQGVSFLETEGNLHNNESFNNSEFFEIAPLQDKVDLENQKNITSKSIEKFALPDLAFMIVDKKNITRKINIITLKKIGNVNINNQLTIDQVRRFILSELLK